MLRILDLKVIGTIGILLKAEKLGLVTNLKREVEFTRSGRRVIYRLYKKGRYSSFKLKRE